MKGMRKCRICQSKIHLEGAYYCQGCSYKKGICGMCGKKIISTKSYRQSATWILKKNYFKISYFIILNKLNSCTTTRLCTAPRRLWLAAGRPVPTPKAFLLQFAPWRELRPKLCRDNGRGWTADFCVWKVSRRLESKDVRFASACGSASTMYRRSASASGSATCQFPLEINFASTSTADRRLLKMWR